MRKRCTYILIVTVFLMCTVACITVYVQKDTTNSSINTSDTSGYSADSASLDVAIPLEVLE